MHIKENYLVISNYKKNINTNITLLECISDFEFSQNCCLFLVLNEKYDMDFIITLFNMLQYLIQSHQNIDIKIYTRDVNLLNYIQTEKENKKNDKYLELIAIYSITQLKQLSYVTEDLIFVNYNFFKRIYEIKLENNTIINYTPNISTIPNFMLL